MIDQKLKQQFDDVISYSQGISNPQTEELLKKWKRAKSDFINEFFKGELSYTYPEKIHFELTDRSKEERFSIFIDYLVTLLNVGYNDEFIEYLYCQVRSKDFFQNSLSKDYTMSNGKKIQQGTKVIKSFKYFITDDRLLAEIQNKASEIIQENKVEGYLTFSVHPLDFLSLSENNFNWRSCHALDGEYRAGNLSYMLDSSTVVCYLKSEQDTILPRFPNSVPWNNKKWRCLLFFDTTYNAIFAGRQYPFTSPGALETIRQIFLDKLVKPKENWFGCKFKPEWSHWHNDYLNNFEYSEYSDEDFGHISEDQYLVMWNHIYEIQKIVKNAQDSRHFNDLLSSSCYTKPYYMFCKHYMTPDLKFLIGHSINCLHCGENIINGQDSMMCSDCECEYGDSDSEDYLTCECCGSRVYYTDGSWVDDEFMCQNCIGVYTFVCEECGLRLRNEYKMYDENTQQFVCKYCYKEE